MSTAERPVQEWSNARRRSRAHGCRSEQAAGDADGMRRVLSIARKRSSTRGSTVPPAQRKRRIASARRPGSSARTQKTKEIRCAKRTRLQSLSHAIATLSDCGSSARGFYRATTRLKRSNGSQATLESADVVLMLLGETEKSTFVQCVGRVVGVDVTEFQVEDSQSRHSSPCPTHFTR